MLTLKRHKRGAAYCRFQGKCYWFGKYGTKESNQRFAAWLATLTAESESTPEPMSGTVIGLCAAFMKHADCHYRKEGKPTGEAENVRLSLLKLSKLYGNLPVDQFGPKLLKSLQSELVKDGLARSTINARINRIRRVFKWGVGEQTVPVSTWQSLTAIHGLEAGRTAARETDPVDPVSELNVLAVQPYTKGPVWGMIQFGLLTGARPGETVRLRWCDIDAEADVWQYKPNRHKTQHHSKKRVIVIGPALQKLLLALGGNDTDFVFRPADAPGSGGNSGDLYTVQSYRNAVIRACERAFGCPTRLRIDNCRKRYSKETSAAFEERRQQAMEWRTKNVWSPNRLRHSYGTIVRSKQGLEAAQVGLGHSDIKTTQRYAEPNFSAAIEYARLHG